MPRRLIVGVEALEGGRRSSAIVGHRRPRRRRQRWRVGGPRAPIVWEFLARMLPLIWLNNHGQKFPYDCVSIGRYREGGPWAGGVSIMVAVVGRWRAAMSRRVASLGGRQRAGAPTFPQIM